MQPLYGRKTSFKRFLDASASLRLAVMKTARTDSCSTNVTTLTAGSAQNSVPIGVLNFSGSDAKLAASIT